MRKDDHLIYESLVQSRMPMGDEQAAKIITDKIKGTPNLNIQNIKMYVQKYLGMVGKSPSDVDYIASLVHDNLQNMGMGENAEGPVKIDRVSATDIIKPVSQQSGPVKIDWGVEDDENASGASAAFHYDPMPGLEKTAVQIRDLLQGAANDEVRTEHIIKMAQTILGSPKDYDANEYRKMLDGLIVLLNRFIVVPMN